MRDEEAFDGAVEHHDLHVGIGLDLSDDVAQPRELLRAENIHRRHVEGDAPVGRQAALQADLVGREISFGTFHDRDS
ncbi:hypothetical protein ACVWZZ_001331 [Bradyrhizobium sp. LM6.10]